MNMFVRSPVLFTLTSCVIYFEGRWGQASDLLPVLTAAVERAHVQSSQTSVVCEGVTAACLLLKLATVNKQAGEYCSTFSFVTMTELE